MCLRAEPLPCVCCSTPVYMSPEQLQDGDANGQGYLGTAVDVWAAGVLLIVMLLGEFVCCFAEYGGTRGWVSLRRVLAHESITGKAFRPDWAQLYRGLKNADMKRVVSRPRRHLPLRPHGEPGPQLQGGAHGGVGAADQGLLVRGAPHQEGRHQGSRAPADGLSQFPPPPILRSFLAERPQQRLLVRGAPHHGGRHQRCGALSEQRMCVLYFLVFAIFLGSACPRCPTSRWSSPRCSSGSSFASF